MESRIVTIDNSVMLLLTGYPRSSQTLTILADDTFGGPCMQHIIVDLFLTFVTTEAIGTIGLISCHHGKIFDFVATSATFIETIVADERSVSK